MERQGKILKTFLIVTVIYTVACGAPVKRDTSTSIGNMIEALVSSSNTLCHYTTQPRCNGETFNINIQDVDNYLQPLLLNDDFSRAVTEAEHTCFNNIGSEPRKCERAEAAITLQATIKLFIAKYRESGLTFSQWIDCSPTDKEGMEQTLCWASTYAKQILKRIATV